MSIPDSQPNQPFDELRGLLAAPQTTQHPPLDYAEWPPVVPIKARLSPQEEYPLDAWPLDLQSLLSAVTRLAGCSIHTAAAALMGSLSLLSQADYLIQTLAPTPKPLSLYMLAMTESGWRKSEAMNLVMAGHRESDARVHAMHAMAMDTYLKEQNNGSKKSSSNHSANGRAPRPRKHHPIAFRNDATIEAMQSRMMGGRPWVIQAPDEAGNLFGNWSFQPTNLTRTLSFYNNAWDGAALQSDRVTDGGREFYLPGSSYALCAAWMGQPDIIMPLVFSDPAANGFIARCLICHDDYRPKTAPRTNQDFKILGSYNDQVTQVREEQDYGITLAPMPDEPPRGRARIVLTPEAERLLRAFSQAQDDRADSLTDTGQRHERSFAARAAEQAARVAAVFSAWDYYGRGYTQATSSIEVAPTYMDGAIRIIRWHQGELSRLAEISGATDLAEHAAHLANRIASAVENHDSRYVNGTGLVLAKLANNTGTKQVRGDPDFRRRVVELLEYEGYVRANPNSRGRYHVNPGIGDAKE